MQDNQTLLNLLQDASSAKRRAAASELAKHPAMATVLIDCFQVEEDVSVQEAIFNALITINTETVVQGLIPFLRGENVALRNSAIEALQLMPEAISPYMTGLLSDPDSDVRILALDVLQILRHPNAQNWLREVIEHDQHLNVCATAVDRLAEIGTVEIIPSLQSLAQRFPDEPFMQFAVRTAIHRIEGDTALKGEYDLS